MALPTLATSLRLFVAVPLAEGAIQALERALAGYDQALSRRIPSARWHVTLAWLGQVPSTLATKWQAALTPLPQIYLPTMRITHIGQGKNKQQLWAYVQPTPQLETIRQTIRRQFWPGEQEEEFAPHITLGQLAATTRRFGPTETLVSYSFVFNHAVLYESDRAGTEPIYIPKARIPLPAA